MSTHMVILIGAWAFFFGFGCGVGVSSLIRMRERLYERIEKLRESGQEALVVRWMPDQVYRVLSDAQAEDDKLGLPR